MSEVARRHGLLPAQVYKWRRLAELGIIGMPGASELPSFVAVEITKDVRSLPVLVPEGKPAAVDGAPRRSRRKKAGLIVCGFGFGFFQSPNNSHRQQRAARTQRRCRRHSSDRQAARADDRCRSGRAGVRLRRTRWRHQPDHGHPDRRRLFGACRARQPLPPAQFRAAPATCLRPRFRHAESKPRSSPGARAAINRTGPRERTHSLACTVAEFDYAAAA